MNGSSTISFFGFDFDFRKKLNIQRHWNIILLDFGGSLGGTTLNWVLYPSRPAPPLPLSGFPVAPWRPLCRAGRAGKQRGGGPGPGAGGPGTSCRSSLDPFAPLTSGSRPGPQPRLCGLPLVRAPKPARTSPGLAPHLSWTTASHLPPWRRLS